MNARSVRTVGGKASNSVDGQPVGLVGAHEVGQVATQVVDVDRRHGIVHPRPDLDIGGLEPALPDGRQGDHDVARR